MANGQFVPMDCSQFIPLTLPSEDFRQHSTTLLKIKNKNEKGHMRLSQTRLLNGHWMKKALPEMLFSPSCFPYYFCVCLQLGQRLQTASGLRKGTWGEQLSLLFNSARSCLVTQLYLFQRRGGVIRSVEPRRQGSETREKESFWDSEKERDIEQRDMQMEEADYNQKLTQNSNKCLVFNLVNVQMTI